MFRSIANVSMVMIVFGAASAFAQETAPKPGRVEVTYTPARGDYRFGITRSTDDAPEFFGRDTRYSHRIYGGVIINMVR
jgi:hypothetical protein